MDIHRHYDLFPSAEPLPRRSPQPKSSSEHFRAPAQTSCSIPPPHGATPPAATTAPSLHRTEDPVAPALPSHSPTEVFARAWRSAATVASVTIIGVLADQASRSTPRCTHRRASVPTERPSQALSRPASRVRVRRRGRSPPGHHSSGTEAQFAREYSRRRRLTVGTNAPKHDISTNRGFLACFVLECET
jgi:hypothetical protein